MKEQSVREALERAFEEPILVPIEEYLGKIIAGCFKRMPDMSGDQRRRLNPSERRAVDNVAERLAEALRIANGQ